MKHESSFCIAIGTDHHGFELKQWLKENFCIKDRLIEWIDVGTFSSDRTDYPSYAVAVVEALRNKKAHCGILMCGSGVGMSIVANRFDGIFAALAWNAKIARESKEEDNSNILVLPADFLTKQYAQEIIETWLQASFKGGRYQDRINMINALGGKH